jgi:hypothetical protein
VPAIWASTRLKIGSSPGAHRRSRGLRFSFHLSISPLLEADARCLILSAGSADRAICRRRGGASRHAAWFRLARRPKSGYFWRVPGATPDRRASSRGMRWRDTRRGPQSCDAGWRRLMWIASGLPTNKTRVINKFRTSNTPASA